LNLNDEADDSLVDLAKKGDCRFYQAMESIKHCGHSGYLIAYGYKYCSRFTEFQYKFDKQVIHSSFSSLLY
jgi:hypothetical protein